MCPLKMAFCDDFLDVFHDSYSDSFNSIESRPSSPSPPCICRRIRSPHRSRPCGSWERVVRGSIGSLRK